MATRPPRHLRASVSPRRAHPSRSAAEPRPAAHSWSTTRPRPSRTSRPGFRGADASPRSPPDPGRSRPSPPGRDRSPGSRSGQGSEPARPARLARRRSPWSASDVSESSQAVRHGPATRYLARAPRRNAAAASWSFRSTRGATPGEPAGSAPVLVAGGRPARRSRRRRRRLDRPRGRDDARVSPGSVSPNLDDGPAPGDRRGIAALRGRRRRRRRCRSSAGGKPGNHAS